MIQKGVPFETVFHMVASHRIRLIIAQSKPKYKDFMIEMVVYTAKAGPFFSSICGFSVFHKGTPFDNFKQKGE